MATFAGQSAARRALLKDMGIDVWVARRGTPTPGVALSEPEPIAEPIPQPIPQPSEAAAAVAARAPQPRAERAQAVAQPRRLAQQPEPVAADTNAPAAVSVPTDIAAVCLAGDQVVMLVDHCPADQRRLMLDVFAAAAGHQQRAAHQELAFSFAGDEQAQKRAFAAFVDKQLADHDPRFVLCSAGLRGHLPDRSKAHPVIVLPALVELGKSVELKRELWQQIQSHQS